MESAPATLVEPALDSAHDSGLDSGLDSVSDTVSETASESATTRTDSSDTLDAAIAEELLVEEISIDGMCGVY